MLIPAFKCRNSRCLIAGFHNDVYLEAYPCRFWKHNCAVRHFMLDKSNSVATGLQTAWVPCSKLPVRLARIN